MHNWTQEDDVVAFYLYRFEGRSKGVTGYDILETMKRA
jgi:hypothetical protein